MPTDRPNAAELVEAVREFLEDHVAPNVEGQLAFHARVAINALAIVERTMGQGDAMDDAELERLKNLSISAIKREKTNPGLVLTL